jgi:hypothetical protein
VGKQRPARSCSPRFKISSKDDVEERRHALSNLGPGQSLEKPLANPDAEDVLGEESLQPILNLQEDPLMEVGRGPSETWLETSKGLKPRTLSVSSPREQEEAVDQILAEIDAKPEEPFPLLIAQTKKELDTLHQRIPDANQFVAGSFQAFFPA